jgi:chaperonin GroES
MKVNDNVGFRPIGNQVLIRAEANASKSAGGILIPDSAQGRPTEGVVLAVGQGSRNDKGELIPLDVKPGDKIMFGKFTGTELSLNGNRLLIMKETDILGILS